MPNQTVEEMWRRNAHRRLCPPPSTGTSFVGSVGEGDARDFTALGDTVNAAARLTGLAGAGEILVSAEAAAAGGLETAGLERRTLDLRGREQGLDAWVATA
jgi:adenylate cyclase